MYLVNDTSSFEIQPIGYATFPHFVLLLCVEELHWRKARIESSIISISKIPRWGPYISQ